MNTYTVTFINRKVVMKADVAAPSEYDAFYAFHNRTGDKFEVVWIEKAA